MDLDIVSHDLVIVKVSQCCSGFEDETFQIEQPAPAQGPLLIKSTVICVDFF